jgi:hypothetical protein
MRRYPGVSAFKVRYKARRGTYQDWTITYTYYKARIQIDGRSRILGHFQTAEAAAEAYRKAKTKYELA